MIVMKFGGTSNEDASAMRNVIRAVRANLHLHPVVVISAIARATNELEQTARLAAAGKDVEATALATSLLERHRGIVSDLIPSEEHTSELESTLSAALGEIKTLIHGIAILGELTPRTMDAICSYGERLSSRIIAAGLWEAGVKSMWIDVKDFMITDDNFGSAQPLTEMVEQNLAAKVAPMLEKGITPVTQGFIGVTKSGQYTTMGRESSDYSASVIGAAMGASLVQIWTDVDGVLTADPRVVRKPLKIKHMTFEEAFELSHLGAKVLHPRTMIPAMEKGIPVQILNSRIEGGTGTLVGMREEDATDVLPKSIAYRDHLTFLEVVPEKRASQFLFWESVFSVLNRHRAVLHHLTTSEYRLAFTVDSRTLSDACVHELQQVGGVQRIEDVSGVSIVGSRLRSDRAACDRFFAALKGASIHMIAFGASDKSMTAIVPMTEAKNAVQNLHTEFFDKTVQDDLFEALS